MTADGMSVVRVGGELDIATVDACRAELYDACAALPRRGWSAGTAAPGRRPAVVVDLDELTFVSACGLRMLAEFALAMNRRGHTTVLVARPSSLVHRLARLAGLDRLVTVVDGPYDAACAATA